MMQNVTIVIPGFNNKKWYKRNLDSVLAQKYKSFKAIYTDDCSTDGTSGLVSSYLKNNDGSNRITFIQNTARVGALENLYNMIHSCDDNDIVITLDADDWFPHDRVLDRVVKEYSQHDTWLTYGQYKEHPHGTMGCSSQIPQNIIDKSIYRKSGWYSSHLRTFKVWLFKQIKKEDLMHNGKFFASAWDLAMMFPMLEMSGPRARFIPEVLYIYNIDNPLNDHKVDAKKQQAFARIVRGRAKYSLL